MYEMCVDCNKKHNSFAWKYDSNGWHCKRKSVKYEFTTEQIKQDRKKTLKSTMQPFRSGKFSAEFKEAYPHQTKRMVKAGTITDKEVRRAKPVWSDLPNYNNWRKTK